jgi:hypothetical protein
MTPLYNAGMSIADAVPGLARDLRDIFGDRLRSVVAFAAVGRESAPFSSTLVVVNTLTADDLRACADRVLAWQEAGLDTPILLEADEFHRSLDAFPFEFGAILAQHAVVVGETPFDGLHVDPADLRRACEVQARSHLLHLREAYIETGGRGDRIADLIVRSARPLAALIRNVVRLEPSFAVNPILARIVQITDGTLASDDARRMFPEYLAAVKTLVDTIDRWSHA